MDNYITSKLKITNKISFFYLCRCQFFFPLQRFDPLLDDLDLVWKYIHEKKSIIELRKRTYLFVFRTTIYLIEENLLDANWMFLNQVNGGFK